MGHSLFGLGFLISRFLSLLFIFLIRFGSVDVFECLELLNEESSHNSILNLTSSENTTISSADCSLGRCHSFECVWSGNLNTLESVSFNVLFDKMKNQFATYTNEKKTVNDESSTFCYLPGVLTHLKLLLLVLYALFLLYVILLSSIFRSLIFNNKNVNYTPLIKYQIKNPLFS